MNTKAFLRLLLPALCCLSASNLPAAGKIELRPRDHIAIIGNTLADRMQHSGWLETLIHSRHPEHDLVVRNLGFSGDELTVRLRSQDFGSQDDWLNHVKADVIFAMFGFNESFNRLEGLEDFRKDLESFIKHTLEQDYSGKGTPRLVLFSPIAQEGRANPDFPDPEANNRYIEMYTEAMAEVAAANSVPFVNLFTLSRRAYEQSEQALTINGIHLGDPGYGALAPDMYVSIFGEPAPSAEGAEFEKLRAAVNDKNAEWFSRYRTIDGYNVYGGRSHLEFDGVKNRDAMLREMEMRDVKTLNRDRRIWAVARGGDLVIQDDNLPPPVEVESNKPGPFEFLTGEEAISRMTVPPGTRVNLFASEEQFPELANPVQMGFDTQGRLWVAVWPNYPARTPWSEKGDSLLVFEDTNNDGRADRCIPFADDLNAPTGFQFYRDGVIVVQAPDVWFLRDTDGDGRADWKQRILNGLDSADSHHTANALALDPGGAIYLSDGVFHRTQVETARGPVRNHDGAIYRFEPRTGKFERYIPYGFANPHGRVFDRWGNDFVTDATGNHTYFGPAFSGFIEFPDKHSGLREFWNRPSRPCSGTAILSSRHFPEEFQGNFLNANVIGFQGIFRVRVKEEGSGLWGETLEPALVQSSDPNFRPTAVDVAPDGSVYFLDWYNPIIGHMQHHLRDPSRDHAHGRIYRITHESRPLLKPAKIAGEPIDKLVALLTEPENNVRTRAKIELGARDTRAVIAAVQSWTEQFDPDQTADQHALMEALWVHQWHNVVNEPLLRQMLNSPDFHARAAAVRVLCYWRDRVADPLDLLRAAANDDSPRVRHEAVRAASFFTGREALEVAHEILKYDTDYYLDYTFSETLRQLRKSASDLYLPEHPRALARVVSQLSDQELMGAPNLEAVLVERLERTGI
ncbi:MAG TPA: PVC-type heme-binding CxxCH protein, partial [Methylomirabilota bacterium]|nr:PVC-type heme-binding CxxCH protein [Methylomirabilota bacterium]